MATGQPWAPRKSPSVARLATNRQNVQEDFVTARNSGGATPSLRSGLALIVSS